MVYHLFTQLEALPNWVAMAAQRQGEMTEFGPLPVECVLTETELDWFTRALELACFFTPLAAERLRELNAARGARTVQQQQPLPPPDAYAAAYDPVAAVLPLPPTSNYALPSRDRSSQLPPPPQQQHQQTMELPIVSVAASLSSGMTADQYSLNQSTAAGTWGVDSYQSAALSASTSSDITGSSDRNSLSPPGHGSFGSANVPNLTGGETSYTMDASGTPLLGGSVEPVPPPVPPQQQQQQPSLTMPWPDVGYDFQLPPQRTSAVNTVSPESTVGIAPPATMGSAGSTESENGQPWQPTPSMPPPPPPPDAGPDSWTNYNTNGWS